MINNVLIGLQTLASITGVSSLKKYETDAQDYINIASAINSVVNFENDSPQIDEILKFGDVYSITGENRYLEAELNDGGFILYDKKENEVIQYSSTTSPYYDFDDTLKIYFDDGGDPHYLFYNYADNTFSDVETGAFDFNNYDFYGSGSHPETFFHPEITPGTNATLIPNAFYFQKLHDYHGFNCDEICCIIAAQILFGYYDTFINDTIVDEIYDKITKEYITTNDVSFFKQSPGTGKESGDDEDQRFRDYLIDITTDVLGESPIGRTMMTSEQKSVIRRYLNDSSFSYVINSSEGNMSDLLTNRARDIIENAIDHGRPVICNGRGHSVVAYGYDSNYVYVHNGWGCVAATSWDTYTYSSTNSAHNIGAIDIRFTCDHVHSDNYYSEYSDKYYCPDGFTFEHAIFNPGDYDYQSQYFFYDKYKYIYYRDNDYVIDTKRLRTGYIENQFINLSPRRQDAGVAYLEYYAPTNVKSIKVSISFWSEYELYIASNHQAKIQYYLNGLWRDSFDLLNDINLSTDRTNQDVLYISFPAGVNTFRFYAENYPVGTQNKGRISIGNLIIIHE